MEEPIPSSEANQQDEDERIRAELEKKLDEDIARVLGEEDGPPEQDDHNADKRLNQGPSRTSLALATAPLAAQVRVLSDVCEHYYSDLLNNSAL